MRPTSFTTPSYSVASPAAIVASVTPSGAGFLTLTSSPYQNGTAAVPVNKYLTLTTAANDTARNFTIVGTDPAGNAITEVLAGGNTTTVTSALAYTTVTSIYVSAATAGAITVGYAQSGYTGWIPLDIYSKSDEVTISCVVSGTINYSVQYTNDDPFNLSITPAVFSHPVAGLVGASTTQSGYTDNLTRAVRVLVNSGSGTVRFTMTQQSAQ